MTSYADGFTYVEEVLLRGTPEEGINIKASHLVRATYFNGRPRIDDPVPINVADLEGFLPEWFAGMVGQVAAAEAARDVALADAKAAQDDRDAKVAAAEADRDAKVTAAEKDRDEKVAAAEADRDAKVAEAEGGQTAAEATVAARDETIATLEARIAELTAPPASIIVSDRQFFQALAMGGKITEAEAEAAVATGTIPADMTALVDQLPPDQQFTARMLLKGATTFRSDHPLSAMLAGLYGLSEEQKLDLFRVAAEL